MKRKAVEDVLDAEQSFKDADSTTGVFERDAYLLAFEVHLLSFFQWLVQIVTTIGHTTISCRYAQPMNL